MKKEELLRWVLIILVSVGAATVTHLLLKFLGL